MASYQYNATDSNYIYIKTPASNVTVRVINDELYNSNYYGVNGTFFAPSSGTPGAADFTMPNSVGISWYDGATVEGSTVIASDYKKVNYWENNLKDNGTKIARGSFTITNTTEGYKCAVYSNSTATGIRNAISGCKAIIGGGQLQLQYAESVFDSTFINESWGNVSRTESTRRTGLGFKVESNVWYVYLIISKAGSTLYQLRNYMKNTLACYDGIFLDGGPSTQMRCGELTERGSYYIPLIHAGRTISTAVVLINK